MSFECERLKPGTLEARTAVPATGQPPIADPADAAGEGTRGTALRIAIDEPQKQSRQAHVSRSTGTAGSA